MNTSNEEESKSSSPSLISKECDVDKLFQKYLMKKGYSYKGICNANGKRTNKFTGNEESTGAEIPFLTTSYVDDDLVEHSRVLMRIDHQGQKEVNGVPEVLWGEAKGPQVGTTQLIQGFLKACMAVYYMGGEGFLVTTTSQIELVLEAEDFLKKMSEVTVGKGRVGLFDVERENKIWF